MAGQGRTLLRTQNTNVEVGNDDDLTRRGKIFVETASFIIIVFTGTGVSCASI